MYRKMQASGLPEFIFSYTPQLSGQFCVLVHLASCILPVPQQSLWGVAASMWSQFWESLFSFGGQKLLMAVTFLFINMEVGYFNFTILIQMGKEDYKKNYSFKCIQTILNSNTILKLKYMYKVKKVDWKRIYCNSLDHTVNSTLLPEIKGNLGLDYNMKQGKG